MNRCLKVLIEKEKRFWNETIIFFQNIEFYSKNKYKIDFIGYGKANDYILILKIFESDCSGYKNDPFS